MFVLITIYVKKKWWWSMVVVMLLINIKSNAKCQMKWCKAHITGL